MIKFAIGKNDKHNDKHMITKWECNYTEMVTLTCSFCLFKLAFNHVMWSAFFNLNIKEEDAESIMAKKFSSHTFFQDEFSDKCFKI